MEQEPQTYGETNERADDRAAIDDPGGTQVSERSPEEGAIHGGKNDPLGEGLADAARDGDV